MTIPDQDKAPQRNATRAPFEGPVRVQFDDSTSVYDGHCGNVSIGGMLIELPEGRTLGSLARFELFLPDEQSIRGLAEVVWVRPKPPAGFGLGLKFRFLEQRDRQLIFKLVSQHIKERLAQNQPAGHEPRWAVVAKPTLPLAARPIDPGIGRPSAPPPAAVTSAPQQRPAARPQGIAPLPSAPVPAEPGPAPVPSAPVPSAPVPSAPVPAAPVPSAPVPSAPVPSARVPTAPQPAFPARSTSLFAEESTQQSDDLPEFRPLPAAAALAQAVVVSGGSGSPPVASPLPWEVPIIKPTWAEAELEAEAFETTAQERAAERPALLTIEDSSVIEIVADPRDVPTRTSRGRIWIAAALTAALAVGAIFWFGERSRGRESGAGDLEAGTEVIRVGPSAEPSVTVVDELESKPSGAQLDTPVKIVPEPAAPAPEQAAPEPAAPEPIPTQSTNAVKTFQRIVDISWREVPGGLEVVILGDGVFSPSRFDTFRLEGAAPREIVRFFGATERFPKSALAVGMRGLSQIRTGSHPDRGRGPELHVVFDLTAPKAKIMALDPVGERLVIKISG
jgi:PilZ domain